MEFKHIHNYKFIPQRIPVSHKKIVATRPFPMLSMETPNLTNRILCSKPTKFKTDYIYFLNTFPIMSPEESSTLYQLYHTHKTNMTIAEPNIC